MMANGFVLGRRNNPTRGGMIDGWEVTKVPIPSITLGEFGEVNAHPAYIGSFYIPFPLEIGGRTFSSWDNFWAATGVGNVMVSCPLQADVLLGNATVTLGGSNGELNIICINSSVYSGGTMYIYCRFTD